MEIRDWRLEINHQQVEAIGRRLVDLNWKSGGFATFEAAMPTRQPGPRSTRESRVLVDFFFYNSATRIPFF